MKTVQSNCCCSWESSPSAQGRLTRNTQCLGLQGREGDSNCGGRYHPPRTAEKARWVQSWKTVRVFIKCKILRSKWQSYTSLQCGTTGAKKGRFLEAEAEHIVRGLWLSLIKILGCWEQEGGGGKGRWEMGREKLLPHSGFQEKGFFPKSSSLPLQSINSHGGRVTYLIGTFRKKDPSVQLHQEHMGAAPGKRVSLQAATRCCAPTPSPAHLPPWAPRCLWPLTAWKRAAGPTPSENKTTEFLGVLSCCCFVNSPHGSMFPWRPL